LKSARELKPLAERIALSRALAPGPRVTVTAFEAACGSRYSADSVVHVLKHRPGQSFVWVMGADNLRDFHHWERWRALARSIPIAITDRPGSTLSFLSSPMALTFSSRRVAEKDAAGLANMRPPAWTFLHGPRSSLSSTALRSVAKGSSPSA
jgi:nicotinate-nucleotide adenylyltransferase